MIMKAALAVMLAALTMPAAVSWAGQVPTMEQVCGKWLGGTTEDAEKWLACRSAYERKEKEEIPRVGATTPTQVYCPLILSVSPRGDDIIRHWVSRFYVTNRGNGVAMGVQVVGSYPASGPRGGTVMMNRSVAFFDKLGPSEPTWVQVQDPIPGEVYSATVSACVPTQ